MSYSVQRLYRVGMAASALVGSASLLPDGFVPGPLSRFRVQAKSDDSKHFTDLNMAFGTKWDHNWDKREPSSLVKPLRSNATDDDKLAYEEKIAKMKPKASRIIVMVRHGQYNLDGRSDSDRYLTELGKRQADCTGERLAQLYKHYLTVQEDNGKVAKPKISIVRSTMTRATETANIIQTHLPTVAMRSCDLIREGAPCAVDPPADNWAPLPSDFFQEGSRIESGFRRYFHRADPEQEETSVDILVCHGNVIRYCVCRALQLDPTGWLRMAVHNGSITVFTITPSGRVKVTQVGEAGHLSPEMLTFN